MKTKKLDLLIAYFEKLAVAEPDKFNLRSWLLGRDIETAIAEWPGNYAKGEPLGCGSAACVAGHLPVLFPEDWRWSAPFASVIFDGGVDTRTKMSYPVCKCASSERSEYTISEDLAEYFGGKDYDWATVIYAGNYDQDSPIDLNRDVLPRLRRLRSKYAKSLK